MSEQKKPDRVDIFVLGVYGGLAGSWLYTLTLGLIRMIFGGAS